MTDNDRREFLEIMRGIASFNGEPIYDSFAVEMWFQKLKSFSIEDVKRAVLEVQPDNRNGKITAKEIYTTLDAWRRDRIVRLNQDALAREFSGGPLVDPGKVAELLRLTKDVLAADKEPEREAARVKLEAFINENQEEVK